MEFGSGFEVLRMELDECYDVCLRRYLGVHLGKKGVKVGYWLQAFAIFLKLEIDLCSTLLSIERRTTSIAC